MILKQVKLLCFLLPVIVCQRSQGNTNLRGHSFGLENYLFQTYEEPEINIRNIKVKRVRPIPAYKTQPPGTDTFELENYPQQYESSRLKPTQSSIEYRKQKPAEPKVQSTQEPTVRVTSEPIFAPSQTVTQEVTADKPRKRIMLRRRRKRPQNVTPSEEDSGNAFKPERIPIFSQTPPTMSDRSTIPAQVNAKSTIQTGAATVVEEVTVTEKPTFETTTQTPSTMTTENPSTINLKTFLKQQTETLSLSELLQTQNLSLADLLRGNKDASAILKARQSIISSTTATNVSTKRKTYNRVEQDTTTKELPKIEVLEASTVKPNYNRFHPKLPRIKPTNQIITKLQLQSENADENLEEPTKPSKRPNLFNPNFDPQNRLNELRLKLRNFQRKTSTPDLTTAVPEKEKTTTTTEEVTFLKKNKPSFQSTNNPEISLILPTKVRGAFQNQNRPERLGSWNNRLPPTNRFDQDKIKLSDDIQPKPIKISFVNEDAETSEENEEPTTTTSTIPPEETKKPEPKDDLIELLKSGHNANKLEKILSSRNMTLQELLDNREKHSLQQDISELFTPQTQTPQPITTSSPTLFDSLPSFHLEEKNPPKFLEMENYEEPYAEESAPTIAKVELVPNRESKQLHLEKPELHASSDLNLHSGDLMADLLRPQDSALWNLSQKSLYYGGSYGYGAQATMPQTTENRKFVEVKTPPPLTDSDIILLETIRRSQDTSRKFKLDFNEFVKEEETPELEDIEKSYIPPAVKSAIIASGVVMGIALFVFIAIFATCGWKQRQIRLKGSSSILGDTLTKNPEKSKRTNTLSPVSFKDSIRKSYKKAFDFDDESSESGSSNAGSYLWSTLKNTFTTRTNTLKSRFEKDEKPREEKLTLRKNESRRKTEDRSTATFSTQQERFPAKKLDRDRNVINTSFHFKRSSSSNNFNECVHGY